MDIVQLKQEIENNSLSQSFIIFKYKDNTFLSHQYINRIQTHLQVPIVYIDDLNSLSINHTNLFENRQSTSQILVYSCDELDFDNKKLCEQKNLFIITKKINSKCSKLFSDYIVECPKLEQWQIKDYVYSNLEGVEASQLDWLLEICNYDIYKLDSEISKLKSFQPNERKYLFKDMIYEGAFNDLSNQNVFNITNSVLNKNVPQLIQALKEIKSFDAEPLGVVTLLYQGLKKLIQVWLSKNPTPQNTGLKSNVIYAINKSPRVYTKNQLLKCFLYITDVDKKLKTGEIETNILIDYIICKLFTC